MPRRADTELVDAVARESSMTRGERVAFGGRLEAAKEDGGGGTRNRRGDFTLAELRGEARGRGSQGAAQAIDRAVGRQATRAEAERHVVALAGTTLLEAFLGYDDALVLRFSTDAETCEGVHVLRSPTWLLRADDEPVARAGDEAEHALEQLRRLEGRTLTEASARRGDAALALCFDDDPYGACRELFVRGRRGAPPRWELVTPDGLLVAAADRTLTLGPSVHG